MAKNITGNMLPPENAAAMFDGTMFTIVSMNDMFPSAMPSGFPASDRSIPAPGLMRFTSVRPVATAMSIVIT